MYLLTIETPEGSEVAGLFSTFDRATDAGGPADHCDWLDEPLGHRHGDRAWARRIDRWSDYQITALPVDQVRGL